MLKYKAKRQHIMNREYLPLGISVVVMVALFIFYPMHYQPSLGEPSWEHLNIENVTFTGFSGEASNNLVFYLSNPSKNKDVILDYVRVNGSDETIVFSVASVESSFPVGSLGRVVCFNVGWVKDQEYKIDLFSLSGQVVASKLVVA
jgi:hypothetical protein